MAEIYAYYKKLYKHNDFTTAITEGWEIEAMKLDVDAVEMLGKEITFNEVSTILFKELHSGKSPGNDGFKLGPNLWEALKEGVEVGELSTTQKNSIIKLLPKKNKDPSNIKNW